MVFDVLHRKTLHNFVRAVGLKNDGGEGLNFVSWDGSSRRPNRSLRRNA